MNAASDPAAIAPAPGGAPRDRASRPPVARRALIEAPYPLQPIFSCDRKLA